MRDIKKVRQFSGNPKYPVIGVSLSKEIREAAKIKAGDRVLLVASESGIVITKEKEKSK